MLIKLNLVKKICYISAFLLSVFGCNQNKIEFKKIHNANNCALESPDIVAEKILKIQRKLNLDPLEPIIIEKGSNEEKELEKLCLLLDKLDSWHEFAEVILGPKSEYDKIRKIIVNVSNQPIEYIKLLKRKRALVSTGKDMGECYYLVKDDGSWVIITRTTWVR